MGEPEEDFLRNEYYDLIQTTCYKRTIYPENCASLLYKTLKVEELKRAASVVKLSDEDEKSLTNILADIQAVSSMSNKVLEELSRDSVKLEDLQKRCDKAIHRCKESQIVLKQIKDEPNDGTTKYCNS